MAVAVLLLWKDEGKRWNGVDSSEGGYLIRSPRYEWSIQMKGSFVL